MHSTQHHVFKYFVRDVRLAPNVVSVPACIKIPIEIPADFGKQNVIEVGEIFVQIIAAAGLEDLLEAVANLLLARTVVPANTVGLVGFSDHGEDEPGASRLLPVE